MKTKFLLIGLLCASLSVNAQYISTSATVPGNTQVYKAGSGAGSLHYGFSGGLLVQSQGGDRALVELQSPSGSGVGTNRTVFQALASATYLDVSGGSIPLYLMSSGGQISIGHTSPAYKLDLNTSGSNDGISITQTGTSAGALHLTANSTGGRHWGLLSMGSSSTPGAGNFSIYDYTAGSDRIFINTSGDVGIGSTAPLARLYSVGTSVGVRGDGGPTGVVGNGICSGNSGTAVGVQGVAVDGATNYGGYFAGKGVASAGVTSYGVYAGIISPGLGSTNYGIYATVGGNGSGSTVTINPSTTNVAGYFNGDVVTTSPVYYFSDKRIKKDIVKLNNSLSIISKLNPVSYNFDTQSNPHIALPREKQYGFISQEIKEILPELTKTVVHPAQFDKESGKEISPSKEVLGLNYNGFIALLTKGIQEQQSLIALQQAQLDEQKKMIEELQKKAGISTGINEAGGANSFEMNQNEPNPFNGETTIKYSLPQSVSTANLLIYDLSGKQVNSFPIEQKGSASIKVTSEKLAAGIYIYSIVADGKVVDTKRMVVTEK